MIRKIFAGIFVFLFVIIALPVITVYGIYRTFILEDAYKDDLLDVAYEMWIESVPEDVEWEEQFGSLDRDEFIEMLKDIFSPEDLRTIADSLEEQIKDASFTEDKILKLNIPFSWMRDKAGLLAQEMAELIVKDLEPCETSGEFDVLEHNCIPEGVLVSTVKDGIQQDLERQILTDIPENYEFEMELPVDAKSGEDVTDYFNLAVSNFFVVGTLILAFLLIVISLIVYKPLSNIIKWDTKAIFIATIIPLILFLLLYFNAEKFQIADSKAQIDLIVLLIKSLSRNIITFVTPIVVISFVLMVISGIYVKKHEVKGSV